METKSYGYCTCELSGGATCEEHGIREDILASGGTPARPDIIVENHGSIAILRGMTDAGYAWIEEHVSGEGYQPFGLGARLAEPRYVQDIIDGAMEDGLLVQA